MSWVPPITLEKSDTELGFELEFVIAHLMLRKKNLFFVQIGANDGMTVDPLYRFVNEFGWSGILVEPVPDAFERLKANYRNRTGLKFINAAVSERDGTRTLYTAGDSKSASVYSSFDKELVKKQTRWVPDVVDRIQEIQVRCISMRTLVDEVEGNEIDILLVDAEGYDFEILKMIDFSKMKPTIICYEHTNLDKTQMQAAATLLASQGYRMTRDNLDTIAYRPDFSYGWREWREAAKR